MKLVIEGTLCTLNEYINEERTHKYRASKIKKQETNKCIIYAKNQLQPITDIPVNVVCDWYTTGRKDPDNIAFGIKFILDGLVKAEMLANDGHKQINSIHHNFYVDKENQRVEVEFKGV